jgi:ketosteroid isomerase-like protein
VIDMRDGKIFRNVDYYDAATIMHQVGLRQVGLLPAQ